MNKDKGRVLGFYLLYLQNVSSLILFGNDGGESNQELGLCLNLHNLKLISAV